MTGNGNEKLVRSKKNIVKDSIGVARFNMINAISGSLKKNMELKFKRVENWKV